MINNNNQVDVLLVGGGIMSATLGTLLHQMDNTLNIVMVEKLPEVAMESSDALNNAGTGHAGYCELNYTPKTSSGSVQIHRALEINAAFEISLQFWAQLVKLGHLPAPEKFINRIPHISFVWGRSNVEFLKQRFLQLKQHHLFDDMQYSEDFSQLQAWMPLMMENRSTNECMAATYANHGTDLDFGALTKYMIATLNKDSNFKLINNSNVKKLKKINDLWHVSLQDKFDKKRKTIKAKFVFLGAGGGALPLLQKSGIAEGLGYGGFPVSGQWLICKNPEIIKQHRAKVYGKAAVGAPPMSVPHLDTRIINDKPALLFGPFAGFTTKFLKHGSSFDLAKSVKTNNFKSLLGAGKNNIDLTKYLVGEVFQSHEQRISALREFLPQANAADWSLENAGQRVQIIKKCAEKWGKLEFGTEIVASNDGSLAALLGASPGASTSVQAMINVIERCFKKQLSTPAWQAKLKHLVPSYGESLIDNAALLKKIRSHTKTILNL